MTEAATGAAAQPAARRGRPPTLVLGTIGHDCHVAGVSILRYAFERAGFRVEFLGALVEQQEFISAAKETAADAILVSSLYGMGRIDCEGLRDKCREAGMGDVLLYIGGILVTDPEEWAVTVKIFKDLGFDRVYPPGTKPEAAIADLRADLGLDGK